MNNSDLGNDIARLIHTPTISRLKNTPLGQLIYSHWGALLVLFFTSLAYIWISIVKHLWFQTHAFDLAIFAQSSWLLSTLQEPFSTVRMILQPADHFAPTYLLLSLPYSLFDSPIYLLAIQIISALAGAIPVYLIAKDKLDSKLAANLLMVAYLFQIGLIAGLKFDFSTSTLAVGFIAWALYFVHTQKLKPYLIFMILALGCKEDIPLLFGAFSLYFVWKKQWRWFIYTALISIAWYILVVYFILPVVFDQPHQYSKIANPLVGWADKERTIREVFIQNFGLALLNPIGLLFAGANLGMRFLLSGANYWSNNWHYGANIAAPLLISTIYGMHFFITKHKLKMHQSSILIAAAIAITTIWTTGLLSSSVKSIGVSRQSVLGGLEVIPNQASVAAQDSLAPQLSSRKHIYLYPRKDLHCFDGSKNCGKVDYIILSQNLPSWPLTREEVIEHIESLNHDDAYEKIYEDQGTFVFKQAN